MREVVVGGKRYSVAGRIGKGGEGEVLALGGAGRLAVKVYNAALRASREDKIRAMVREGLASQTDLIAFPGEIATDEKGQFIGFAMRLVSGYRPIHELYSPKSRLRHFPKADYRFIIRAALNVARAVGKVHQSGCVIGDLNHSGVLVSQDMTAALIDADSFQFKSGARTFPCMVGVPDFTPPELHGVHLGMVERNVLHDNFGLAIAIFHLLFMGRHPYAGRYKGPDISLGEAIAQNRFAFSLARRTTTQVDPPPGALTLDVFPDPVRDAFECAFGLGPAARPGASEWVGVLSHLEGRLNRCGRTASHYYPGSAKNCVWCELGGLNRFDMFPDLSFVGAGAPTDTLATEQAIREILAFRLPAVDELLPQPAAGAGQGSSALQEARGKARRRTLFGLLLVGGAAVGLFNEAQAWLLWLGVGGWGIALLRNREVDPQPFRAAFVKADEAVQRELESFTRRSGLGEVLRVRSDLDAAISSYRNIDGELAQELARFKSTREARQRAAYLDRFTIQNAKISGIGPAKKATLISFGIETAADVDRTVIRQIPGFGDVMTDKVMHWRRGHEARFRYNPNASAQDIADERALRGRFASKRAGLEASIRSGLSALRASAPRMSVLTANAHRDPALARAVEERARAQNDLKALGAPVPNSSVALRAPPAPSPPLQVTPARPTHQPPPYTPPRTRVPPLVPGVPSCPRCGAQMRRRTGRYGSFWGCSRYPVCRGTRN